MFSLKRLVRLPRNPSTIRATHTPAHTCPSSADRLFTGFTHWHAHTHKLKETHSKIDTIRDTQKFRKREPLGERYTKTHTKIHSQIQTQTHSKGDTIRKRQTLIEKENHRKTFTERCTETLQDRRSYTARFT